MSNSFLIQFQSTGSSSLMNSPRYLTDGSPCEHISDALNAMV